jgi:type IV pilus assembly protein PilC
MPVNFTNEQLEETAAKNKESQSAANPKEPKKRIVAEGEKVPLLKKIDNFLLGFSRVPLKERLFFVQHLGVMLKAGISLSTAILTLSEQTENKLFAKTLKDISDDVNKGESFSDSLRKHEKVFSELFISMIEAGEISGNLEAVLNQLFIQMKKEHSLLSKVKGALTYPAVIIMAMFGIGTFMMVFVVPNITSMFKDFDAELPLPTKILINTSEIIAQNGLLAAAIFIAGIIILGKLLKTQKGKFIFQSLLLHMPVISPIVKKINLARFSRNISSLLKTDIMIIKCFQITAKTLNNLHYRSALLEMSQKIKKGGKISEVINSYPKLFTPIVSQMVSIGEETGELDTILIELAEFYEEEVDQIMENLPAIIEPILILVLGLGVGSVAIAIIMPMYTITSSI